MKKILLFLIIIPITHSLLAQTNYDTLKSSIIPYHILFFYHNSDTNISIYHEKFFSLNDYKRYFDKNVDKYLKFDKQFIYMLNSYSNPYINISPDYYFKTVNLHEEQIKGIDYSIDRKYYYMNTGNSDSFPAAIIVGSLNFVLYHLFYDE